MWRDSPLGRRLTARLATWDRDGRLRTLRPPFGIDLSSNDYLNLSRHPNLVRAFADAARGEGVGSTGSRLLRGERTRFSQLEARFARFKGADRALYFSSGYLANLAVLTTLSEPGDVIFSDALNHASLVDGIRLTRAKRQIFRHADVGQLEALLRAESGDGVRFVVVESVFSMDGDLAPLADLLDVCRRFEAVLVVDEAHAVGVFGANGQGLVAHDEVGDVVCVSVNSAGKALGAAGAFVAGPVSLVDYLVQRARPFVFSTAAPPATAAAIEASLDLVDCEPWRRQLVLGLASRLRRRLERDGIMPAGASQIVPIVIGPNGQALAVAERLRADGFDVRAIRPPSVPEGTARLRISINAGLAEDVVDRFAGAVLSACQDAGLSCAASS
jgi:8-amino-7-oxononanoate synthase